MCLYESLYVSVSVSLSLYVSLCLFICIFFCVCVCLHLSISLCFSLTLSLFLSHLSLVCLLTTRRTVTEGEREDWDAVAILATLCMLFAGSVDWSLVWSVEQHIDWNLIAKDKQPLRSTPDLPSAIASSRSASKDCSQFIFIHACESNKN